MSGFGQTVYGVLPLGDSKTASPTDYIPIMIDLLNQVPGAGWLEAPARIAKSGWGVADAAAEIDAELAQRSYYPASFCLINIGANDTGTVAGDPAAWEANLGYVLDAIHTKWPAINAKIMRIWKRGDATVQAALNLIDNTLIPGAIASRAWCQLGPDERVWLENGDDGATYTSDGTHYNDAGAQAAAQQWKTALGY